MVHAESSPAGQYATQLHRVVLQHLDSRQVNQGEVSLRIVDLEEKKLLYALNSDLSLNPASNMKIVTAIGALQWLGPDYRFKTAFYSDKIDNKGWMHNLYIKGHGDPSFTTEHLESLPPEFLKRGIRGIEGSIYVDDSFFSKKLTIHYPASTGNHFYQIHPSSLPFNFNTLEVLVSGNTQTGKSATLGLNPKMPFIQLKNLTKIRKNKKGSPKLTLAFTDPEEKQLVVQGSLPARKSTYSFRYPITNGAYFTSQAILESLRNAKIQSPPHTSPHTVPEDLNPFYIYMSPPLTDILKGLGKFSNNFMAEQVFLNLGAEVLGPPATPQKSVEILTRLLADLGIREGTFVLENGSGLSRENRLSATQLVSLLEYAYHQKWRSEFISTLSIAGRDGTIRHRMKKFPLRESVYAKTGTLNHVHALSGYLIDEKTHLAFSFIVNSGASPTRIHQLQENLLKTAWQLHQERRKK